MIMVRENPFVALPLNISEIGYELSPQAGAQTQGRGFS